MAAAGKLKDLAADLVAELTRLQQEKQALEITVNNLRNHKAEAEGWLSENWQKYSQAKADYALMKKRALELADGLEQAGA